MANLNAELKKNILEMSRQNQVGDLTPWFDSRLDDLIDDCTYMDDLEIKAISNLLVDNLRNYKNEAGIKTAVVGMSGGVDSALTAALLKEADWNVIGVTMPIHQEPTETARGVEAIEALGIHPLHVDLSNAYDDMIGHLTDVDFGLHGESKAEKIRRGNIRARLRMITLYNLAAAENGLVASTDNYSELAAGFWTLHGDVGDLSPIQAMTKSWEVPMLAKTLGVPESIWRAKPTDGLGVDDGDEAQFGFTYLELDLMLLSVGALLNNGLQCDLMLNNGGINLDNVASTLGLTADGEPIDKHAFDVFTNLMQRMSATWYKRLNPVNLDHPFDTTRYRRLEAIDNDLFRPDAVK